MPRHDDYAVHRCECGHLVYADETPGGRCRFCECGNHRPPHRLQQADPDNDYRFEEHGVSGYEL